MSLYDLPDDDTVYPRSDGRPVSDQMHGRYTDACENCGRLGIDHPRDDDGCIAWKAMGVRVPHVRGNVGVAVRSHDLADWLLALPDVAVVLDTDGDGPECSDAALFEMMTAHDDPEPYDIIVVRSRPQPPTPHGVTS